MNYAFSVNTYDRDGDLCEKCVLAYCGQDTILKFKDVAELEYFALKILASLKEIKETDPTT